MRLLVTARQRPHPDSASGSEGPSLITQSAGVIARRSSATAAGHQAPLRRDKAPSSPAAQARPAASPHSRGPFYESAAARARQNYLLDHPTKWIPAAPRAAAPRAARARPSADAAAAATLAREIGRGCALSAGVWDRVLMAPDPTEGLRAIARRSLARGPDGGPAEPELAWMADMVNIRSACAPRRSDPGRRARAGRAREGRRASRTTASRHCCRWAVPVADGPSLIPTSRH